MGLLRHVLGLLLLLLALAAPASAQLPASALTPAPAAPTAAAPAPSTAELEGMVRTLQDPAQRARLVGQIQALIAAQRAGAAPATPAAAAQPVALGDALVSVLSGQVAAVGHAVAQAADPSVLVEAIDSAERIAMDPQQRLFWAQSIATVLGALLLALLAERALEMALAGLRRRLHVGPERPFPLRLLALVVEILLRWLPVAAFLVVGYAALAVALGLGGRVDGAGIVVTAILKARAMVRAVMVVAVAVLAPPPGRAGLWRMEAETAGYWLVWLGRLLRFGVYSHFLLEAAVQVGMAPTAYVIISKVLGLVFTGLLIMLLLQNRATIAGVIRGHGEGGLAALRSLRASAAELWQVVAILYVLGGYGVWAAEVPGGLAFLVRATLLSAVIILAARLLAAGGTRLAERLLRVLPDLSARFPDLQRRVNLYAPALIGAGKTLLYAIATLLVLQAWGLDVLAWLATATGRGIVGGLAVIVLTVVVAVAAWEVVGFGISSYLLRPGPDGTPVTRSARARTLLPLLRRTLAIFLAALVALVVLSELGINIAPLLAGAGIAGIAIGFGAQTLVKDVITGLFILMQDVVAVGDVVSVGGQSGLVEDISIRSIRLRDLTGTVIMVPFSEVSTVQNLTKDFSFAVFDIGVSYREDVEQVVALLIEIAEELRADPEHGWRILEPLEMYGLDKFADSAVIVKCRLKTRPIQQWTVMRQFNLRVKKKFDALGIEIPFPHQTIYFGADKQGNAPPVHVQMAAEQAKPDAAIGAAAAPAAPANDETP